MQKTNTLVIELLPNLGQSLFPAHLDAAFMLHLITCICGKIPILMLSVTSSKASEIYTCIYIVLNMATPFDFYAVKNGSWHGCRPHRRAGE